MIIKSFGYSQYDISATQVCGGCSDAIRRLTSDPAELFGIRDRRRLLPGLAADIAIFDPRTIGSSNRGERRYDLPGGRKRMVMPSRGVQYTIVNGVTTYADGGLSAHLPARCCDPDRFL